MTPPRPGDRIRFFKPNIDLPSQTDLIAGSLEMIEGADSAADIDEIGAAPAPESQGGSAAAPTRRVSRERGARNASRAAPARPPAAEPTPGPAGHLEGELTLEALVGYWPAVVETVGKKRRMAREALAHATPAGVAGDEVAFEVSDSEVHLEGLERSRDLVVEAIAEVVGKSVRIVYRATAEQRAQALAAEPKRLDRDGDRDERLRRYRAEDGSLDAVADALDLELLD